MNMSEISIVLAQKLILFIIMQDFTVEHYSEYVKNIHRDSTATDFVHYNRGLHYGALYSHTNF